MTSTEKSKKEFFLDIDQLIRAKEQFENIAQRQKELRQKHDSSSI